MDSQSEEIAALIYKYLVGDISPLEEVQLQVWRKLDNRNEEFFQEMCEEFANDKLAIDGDDDPEIAWKTIVSKTTQSSRSKQRKWLLGATLTGCIVIAVLIGIRLSRHRNKEVKEVALRTISTKSGERKELTLPDSSKVLLNSESSITYPEQFSDTVRNVSLSGEGYFDIQKIKSREGSIVPFVVSVMRKGIAVQKIEVKGTRFNCRAYDSVIKTTLLEGAVSIQIGKQARDIKPGQQAVIELHALKYRMYIRNDVDTSSILGWKEGRIVFDSATIQEICEDLSRRFNTKFKITRRVKGSISAQFPSTFTLSKICNYLSMVTDARFEIREKEVVVR